MADSRRCPIVPEGDATLCGITIRLPLTFGSAPWDAAPGLVLQNLRAVCYDSGRHVRAALKRRLTLASYSLRLPLAFYSLLLLVLYL